MGRHEFSLKILSAFVAGLLLISYVAAFWPFDVGVPFSFHVFSSGAADSVKVAAEQMPPPYIPPTEIKAVYATSNTALLPKRMAGLKKLIDETELNAIVINVNDSNKDIVSRPELAELIRTLNADNIHTIARIVVFQNEALVGARPELALKTHNGNIWRDGGGHRWVDPASQKVWQEILKISEQAVAAGFRELNYDYIRFPSDGAVARAVYPNWRAEKPKQEVINDFAKYLRKNLKSRHPDLILSVDIFAHSILVDDDTHIGQKFIDIVDYFDVTAPMVYPSHYRAGNFGFKNPAANPYGVVFGTLDKAKKKLEAAGKSNVVIRPWLQDFDMGAVYNAAMVKQEIKAVKDAGFASGWMLWNPHNVYTQGALELEQAGD